MRAVWTPQAEDDLVAVVRSLDDFSSGAGDRFVEQLLTRLTSLEAFPRLGRMVPEYGIPVLREIIVRNYRLIYELFPDRIEIVAVRRGAEQLPTE